LWIVAVLVVTGAIAFAADEQMQVQVRQAPVREKPEALAPIVGTLKYADKVVVHEQLKTGWFRVSNAEQAVSGYLRASSLAKKVADLKAGEGAASASAEDVALAGKGLKDSVERYVAQHNLQAAIAKLDDIERRAYTELSLDEVSQFQTAGGLSQGEAR
jgi:hypothetical protein